MSSQTEQQKIPTINAEDLSKQTTPDVSVPEEEDSVLIVLLRLDLRINDNALFH